MEKPGIFRYLIRNSFYEEAQFAAEKRKKLKLKSILFVSSIALVIVLLGIAFLMPNDGGRQVQAPPILEFPPGSVSSEVPPGGPPSQKQNGDHPVRSTPGSRTSIQGGGASSRTRTANQVIRRGMNGSGDPNEQIPVGSVIRAELQNTIQSANTGSPVIAVTLQETQSQDGITIPKGTKILGSGNFDDQNRRIQIQFQTLIYEDGTQHPIQAMAVMPDGSAGLDGDYHSGEGKRELGQFFGNFVGGLADGMKERTSGGGFYGGSIEPGSIKNGLLNGVSISASDEAKNISNNMGNERPSMSIKAGFQFLLFLQKEYVP